VPLVEVSLEGGAVLTLAAEGLLWASDRLHIDLVPATLPGGEGPATSPRPHLQVRGPGSLALTAGTTCTVLPVELAPGAVLEVAAGVLLAWSRGIRAWRTGPPDTFPAGRLAADRASLALLRCPGGVQCLDLPPGDWLTVAPRALLVTMGAIGCATLRRHGAPETAPLIEYRLSGPGRVLLGTSPLADMRR
jgi:uncharacterized protein (AIM24 family)